MAWSTPVYPITGQLITAGFWGAQIPDLMNILKTSVADDGSVKGPLKGYHETVQALSISGGGVAVDCSLGNHVTVSLTANITSFTLSNVPTTGKAFYLVVYFTADGTLRTITHSLNGHTAKFPSGNPPTMTSTNGKIDTLVYSTIDGGATFFGAIMGQNQ
jgi:hypothetical protein